MRGRQANGRLLRGPAALTVWKRPASLRCLVRRSVHTQFWLSAVFLLAQAVEAQDVAPTAAPIRAEPPAVQETTARGTLPDLAGRWLTVAIFEPQEGAKKTLVSLWEVTTSDGKPVLTQRFYDLPALQKAALETASSTGQPWTPSAEDVAAVRAGWATLTPVNSQVRHLQTEIAAPDGFDPAVRSEARTEDAILTIRQRHDMHPSAAPVIRYAFVYAALAKADSGDYTGNFDGVMIAAAPVPIPIPVQGSFRMYRLDAPAPQAAPGLLARLLGLFRTSEPSESRAP